MDDAAAARLRSALRILPVPALKWPACDACFLAGEVMVAQAQAGFLFASGTRPGLQEDIERLAAPGRIDWTS